MFHIAIVGAGNIAPSHIEGLLAFPDRCKIVALCDIYPQKAQRLKEKYNLDCTVFSDHETMLAQGETIDIVHVCTPPYTHAEIAIHAMDAGKNVLVEKPMATCLAECDAMLEAEKRNSVTMGCIAQNRFRNSIYKLKQMLDAGTAGKLRVAHVNSLWWRGHSYYDLWWRGLWEKEGGGCTLNHAVHHIDMINWMQGELPGKVTAVLSNVMHDNAEVEDLSFSTLQYGDGSVAQVVASVVHHGEEQGLVLQCEKAKLAAPWSCYASQSKENGFPLEDTRLEETLNQAYEALPDLPYEGHTAEIDNYQRALESGTRPMITGTDGRNTVELITAIYKSGALEQTVTLPIGKDDPFYSFDGLLAHAPRFYHKTTCVENFAPDDISTGNYEQTAVNGKDDT